MAGVEGKAANRACRTLRPLRATASRRLVCGTQPHSPGRTDVGGTGHPLAALGESRAGTASKSRLVAWLARDSVMACLCACRGVGIALWIGNGDAPVIVETTFRAGICRLRGHHSPAACRRKASA